MEQFRLPRSKKRRIRQKWANRPENWRKAKEQHVYADGLNVIIPPDQHTVVHALMEVIPQVNPQLAAIVKMLGIF